MRIFFFILIVVIIGCQNQSDILPSKYFHKIEKYHCFPYDVTIYKVDDVITNEEFINYPTKEFCTKKNANNLIKWVKFSEYVDINKNGLISVIDNCDNQKILSEQIKNGVGVYFTCCYRHSNNLEGKKIKVYNKIAFLDPVRKELHVFEDIQ